MTAFLALIKKDLTLFLLDRRAVIMSFAAPILIGSFFGYVFSGQSGAGGKDSPKLNVLVVDQDDSSVSREIVAKLQADSSLTVKLVPEDQARALTRKGSAPVSVVIPKDFGTRATAALFMPKDKPKLTFLVDPSHQAESAMVKGILTGHVMQAVSKEAFGGATGRKLAADALPSIDDIKDMPADQRNALKSILQGVSKYNIPASGETSGGGGGLSIPFESAEEALTAQAGMPYNPYGHSFAGMAVQFILFMGIDVGINLLLQRQRGLWKRFRAAPLSKFTLLGSRAVSATLIGIVIMSVVFAFARVVFGVQLSGGVGPFLAICASFGMMTAAYGLLIAALGKTAEAARGLSLLATLLMVMLSGAWIPSFMFPKWLIAFTQIIPARWAVDALDGVIWRGFGWSETMLPVAILIGFAALFGSIAVARFRWDGE